TEINLPNGYYFWRIKVLNNDLPNLYSGCGTFSILPQISQILQISEPASPKVSALFQSFPNPTEGECWIPFQLAFNIDHLSFSIYNIVGQKVKTIDVGPRKAGCYTTKDRAIFWDTKNNSGQNVSKGLYFINLKAGNFSAIKSMIIRR
ncbi:MAG: FlgD immunoglobulin-like domain containing protein, partial [bacterium]|nr:FlgD immunoglobulin-like domain containing protein [bacterium]